MSEVEKLLADSKLARDYAINYKILAEVYQKTAERLEQQGLDLIWSGVEKIPVG